MNVTVNGTIIAIHGHDDNSYDIVLARGAILSLKNEEGRELAWLAMPILVVLAFSDAQEAADNGYSCSQNPDNQDVRMRGSFEYGPNGAVWHTDAVSAYPEI